MIDVDATLVTAHSDKELAAPTFKKGFGFTRCFLDDPKHRPVAPGTPGDHTPQRLPPRNSRPAGRTP